MEESYDSGALSPLIARLRLGDEAAAAAIVNHSIQRLETLARHMLRGYPTLRRWVETNDVLQSALIRLMRALREVKLESPRHFMALSALQIRRELIDLARHYNGPTGLAANHESQGGQELRQRTPDVADLSSEPSTLAQWRELHEQIGLLPDRERETIDILYYDGMSQVDAASLLGVSVRTVQRRWHNALLMLHQTFPAE